VALRNRIFVQGAIPACVAVIAIADLLLWRTDLPLLGDGLLDEVAHVATALLAAAALVPRASRDFVAGLVVGAVLIDVDHVPVHFGWHGLEPGTSRPYPHSLLTLALLVVVALVARGRARTVLAGASLGLAAHFFRDLAEPGQNGAGVMLLWPASDHAFTFPYAVEAAVVLLLALVATLRRRPGRRSCA
jgi:hypothetical protein